MAEINTEIRNETELIRKARKNFIALACAYFLGVFNDNFFKQAICLMAVGIGKSEFQGDATVVFALPFLLFAAPAGWFSDKYSKRSVIVWAKALEVAAMLMGGYGILYDNWSCILIMLFIMALQSTIASPALNGAIPELYPKSYVTKANSIVKLVSTSAILIGIAAAGPAIEVKNKSELEAVKFTTSSISEVRVFFDTLKSNQDETSKLIVSRINPLYLEIKKEPDKSISEVFSFQIQLFTNKIKSFFGGTTSIEKNELDEINLELKKDMVNVFNALILEGKIAEQIKSNPFYTKSLAEITPPVKLPTDYNYVEALISRKYLENQYSAHLKLIETTQIGKTIIAIIILLVAIIGWLVSLGIPKLSAAKTTKSFPFWGPLDTIKVIFDLRKDYLLSWTFFGSMFFYSVASLIVLKINSMGVSQFHFSFKGTSLLVVALLCGICVGSLIAGRISTEKIWFKLLPPALLMMGIFLTLIYFAPQISPGFQYQYLFLMMVLTGVGGGIFVIPTESFCQTRPEPSRKGEILSAHNFVDFAGILTSGVLYYVLEALFPKHTNCMAFLGLSIILLSLVFFIAFLKVTEKEKKRESIS